MVPDRQPGQRGWHRNLVQLDTPNPGNQATQLETQTMTTLTLLKTIPSNSHNAPYSPELGEHWPAGQQFKLLDKRRQKVCQRFYRTKSTSTVIEQIGGEEVLVTIPNDRFVELFGIESPYAQPETKKAS